MWSPKVLSTHGQLACGICCDEIKTLPVTQMMNDLPDVAGSLFTNQYKAVKIEGKRVKPNALEGTGSVCDYPDTATVNIL